MLFLIPHFGMALGAGLGALMGKVTELQVALHGEPTTADS
jgi:uncharacterized membrane protein